MSQIIFGIGRSRTGIVISVEATPEVEGFFATSVAAQQETPTQVGMFGREWIQVGQTPLEIYPLPGPTFAGQLAVGYNDAYFRLDQPGAPMFLPGPIRAGNANKSALRTVPPHPTNMVDREASSINLTPLRLVGISRPGGVSFKIDGVWSTSDLQAIRDKFQAASATFYLSYLQPVHLIGKVSKAD
jgi:hypothetical protein